ncbi:MAG TPA: HAD family acid phosphatase [Xanthomonadaceae bacterium]|nr:HAD family acid phosphatase [Xanthomonadaceae bacterium]
MKTIRAGSLLVAVLLTGCVAAPERAQAPQPLPAAATAHDNLNATLWMQSSAEYAATALQTFRQACEALDAALQDPSASAVAESERAAGFESLPPAAIADIDETLLDNSAYQAWMIQTGTAFSRETWSVWVDERSARPIPGALAFAECAQAKGVTLIYLSNRSVDGAEATIDNLRAVGFPLPPDAGAVVLLQGDTRAPEREKGTRRRWVGQRYRVVALLGDNLGDFLDGVGGTVTERARLVAPYAHWWGERWFMLPNPGYGSWEGAVLSGCAHADSDPATCKRQALQSR